MIVSGPHQQHIVCGCCRRRLFCMWGSPLWCQRSVFWPWRFLLQWINATTSVVVLYESYGGEIPWYMNGRLEVIHKLIQNTAQPRQEFRLKISKLIQNQTLKYFDGFGLLQCYLFPNASIADCISVSVVLWPYCYLSYCQLIVPALAPLRCHICWLVWINSMLPLWELSSGCLHSLFFSGCHHKDWCLKYFFIVA
jgi:hypothetical protein